MLPSSANPVFDSTLTENEPYEISVLQSYMPIAHLIQEISANHIMIPHFHRSIGWSREDIKDLIKSVFLGIPIGEITLWRLHKSAINATQYRSIHSSNNTSPEFISLILDGVQRCVALIAVFSQISSDLSESLKDLALYYDVLTNQWKFKEELEKEENRERIVVNLKETYNPMGNNALLFKRYLAANHTKIEDRIRS